jgi:hypothetical protein
MPEVLYQVEKIVDGPDEQSQFLIKWEGYPNDQNTWEPLEYLPEDMVGEYLVAFEEKEAEEARAAKQAKVAKQRQSKRQKIPGVHIAKVVDDSNSVGHEPARIPRIPKGMGRSSVVAVQGKFLIPQAPLRAVDPNEYLNRPTTIGFARSKTNL